MAENGDKQLHEIFNINPLELQSFIDKYVQFTLPSGENIFGLVLTIDPVSLSIILIGDDGKSRFIKIIQTDSLKESLNSMKIIPDIPENLKDVDINDLFNHMKVKKSSGEMKRRKEKVRSWLVENLINVVEEGDLLVLDTLKIHPPYNVDDCLCTNTIVLDRVQKLLNELNLDKN